MISSRNAPSVNGPPMPPPPKEGYSSWCGSLAAESTIALTSNITHESGNERLWKESPDTIVPRAVPKPFTRSSMSPPLLSSSLASTSASGLVSVFATLVAPASAAAAAFATLVASASATTLTSTMVVASAASALGSAAASIARSSTVRPGAGTGTGASAAAAAAPPLPMGGGSCVFHGALWLALCASTTLFFSLSAFRASSRREVSSSCFPLEESPRFFSSAWSSRYLRPAELIVLLASELGLASPAAPKAAAGSEFDFSALAPLAVFSSILTRTLMSWKAPSKDCAEPSARPCFLYKTVHRTKRSPGPSPSNRGVTFMTTRACPSSMASTRKVSPTTNRFARSARFDARSSFC
mmetsp:Transcript_37855/g.87283  ORF Transcript_37855/g.87283 Transcript_37855/m.87283 type:complete len:354 (-) Transcript_37855:92-1153(-)